MKNRLKMSQSARAAILAAAFLIAARPGAPAQSTAAAIIGPPAPAAAETNSASMRFRVLDSVTAAPVPGVKVRVAWVRNSLVTDAAGSCSFAMPKPATNDFSYVITLTKDGYVSKTITWATSRLDKMEDIPAEYTSRMEKAATIGGVLKGPDGQPLAGAIIRFSGVNPASPADRERTLVAPNFHNERTDENGRWECNHVPAGFFQPGLPRRPAGFSPRHLRLRRFHRGRRRCGAPARRRFSGRQGGHVHGTWRDGVRACC